MIGGRSWVSPTRPVQFSRASWAPSTQGCPGLECRGQHHRGPGYGGKAEGLWVWERSWESVIEDKESSQKSAQGNPGAAGVLVEQLEPRSRAALQDEGVQSPPGLLNSSVSFSPEPCTSPV